MIYNLFFNLKDSTDEPEIIGLAAEFAELLKGQGDIDGYMIEKTTPNQSLPDLPEYHMAVYFKSKSAMDEAFQLIREKYMNIYQHAKLMSSVSEFKVTFSEIIKDSHSSH
ncbi:MAG: hypothetical protein K6L73_14705 [Cellvibrionaceae bacterium]